MKDWKRLNLLCEAALNEGAGAAITFHFDEKDRDYKIDVDYDAKGLEIKVSNLLITDYYHSNKAYDGGKFVFTEDDLKEAVVKDNNDYSEDKIKKEDIKSVEIVGVEEMPNLTCSWGWVRSDIPDEMIITKQSNDYYAVLQVDAQIGDVKTMYTVEVDGKYIPSDEVKIAYDNLGEDDDDFDESLNEDLPTSQEYKFNIEKLNDKGDFRLTSGDEYVSDIYVPEGDTLKDNIRDYIDCEFMYDLDDSENICSTELSDYKYDEENGEGSFTATIFWDEDLNESVDEHTEVKCRMYARMLEKINEKFGTLIGTFKIEPLYTDKYELGLKRGYGKYDFKFVSDDAFLPLKNKSLEEQAEYLKGLILGKE